MLRTVSACFATLSLILILSGCETGVDPGFIGDTGPDAPAVADGPVVVTYAETDDAVVLHVPLARPEQADHIAAQMAALLTSLNVPTWGAADAGFGVPGIDWRIAVRDWIEESIANGAIGDARLFAKGLDAVNTNLLSATTELAPASAAESVGALPIIAVYTGSLDYGLAGGIWVDARLRSQSTTCAACTFTQPATVKQTRIMLLTPGEVADLVDAGHWSGGINFVIAKSAVWWAPSQNTSGVTRNWINLAIESGSTFDIRCQTATGVYP